MNSGARGRPRHTRRGGEGTFRSPPETRAEPAWYHDRAA